MLRTVEQQRLSPFQYNLPYDDGSDVCVTLGGNLLPLFVCRNFVPIERWISKKDSDTPDLGLMLIDFACGGKEPPVDGSIPNQNVHGVTPCAPQFARRDICPIDVLVHHVLITRTAEFNNDVVDPNGEVGGSNQRNGEIMHVLVPMRFAQCNQVISVKGGQDSPHGVMRLRIVDSAIYLQRRAIRMKE